MKRNTHLFLLFFRNGVFILFLFFTFSKQVSAQDDENQILFYLQVGAYSNKLSEKDPVLRKIITSGYNYEVISEYNGTLKKQVHYYLVPYNGTPERDEVIRIKQRLEMDGAFIFPTIRKKKITLSDEMLSSYLKAQDKSGIAIKRASDPLRDAFYNPKKYFRDKTNYIEPEGEDIPIYYVQIAASLDKKSRAEIKNILGGAQMKVIEKYHKGIYKYLVSPRKTREGAIEERDKVRKVLKDAFVVRTFNGIIEPEPENNPPTISVETGKTRYGYPSINEKPVSQIPIYFVQVGAFSKPASKQQLESILDTKEYPLYHYSDPATGLHYYLTGSTSEREKIEALKNRIPVDKAFIKVYLNGKLTPLLDNNVSPSNKTTESRNENFSQQDKNERGGSGNSSSDDEKLNKEIESILNDNPEDENKNTEDSISLDSVYVEDTDSPEDTEKLLAEYLKEKRANKYKYFFSVFGGYSLSFSPSKGVFQGGNTRTFHGLHLGLALYKKENLNFFLRGSHFNSSLPIINAFNSDPLKKYAFSEMSLGVEYSPQFMTSEKFTFAFLPEINYKKGYYLYPASDGNYTLQKRLNGFGLGLGIQAKYAISDKSSVVFIMGYSNHVNKDYGKITNESITFGFSFRKIIGSKHPKYSKVLYIPFKVEQGYQEISESEFQKTLDEKRLSKSEETQTPEESDPEGGSYEEISEEEFRGTEDFEESPEEDGSYEEISEEEFRGTIDFEESPEEDGNYEEISEEEFRGTIDFEESPEEDGNYEEISEEEFRGTIDFEESPKEDGSYEEISEEEFQSTTGFEESLEEDGSYEEISEEEFRSTKTSE